jgi:hypothetical protein
MNVFGWFKKKPTVPPITDALYATMVGCGSAMLCQVNVALGKAGEARPIGDAIGMGASFLVGCYAYGFIDGSTKTSGALQARVNGDERMMFYGHEALVRSALEGAFGKGFESKAARITEAVFAAKPWNHPKLLEAGGRDGVAFATTDAKRLQHMIAGKDTPPTTFAPTRLIDVLSDFAAQRRIEEPSQ